MGLGRNDRHIGRRNQRSPVLPALLSVTMLGLAVVSYIVLRPTLGGRIVDAYTGEPLDGVTVTYGSQRAKTNAQGRFTLSPQRTPLALGVIAPSGYACEERPADSGEQSYDLSCRPTTLSGTLRHKNSDAPLSGISVQAINDDNASSSQATSDDEGWYQLTEVPTNARLIVEGPGYGRKEVEIGTATTLDLSLRPDIVTGKIQAKGGAPIPGASVGTAGAAVVAAPDGSFTLAGIPEGGRIFVRASGYRTSVVEPGESQQMTITMEPLVVKAIYLTPDSIIHDDKFNALVALADRTEINAMVIDFKDEEGQLLHDSQVPLAREIGAVYPRYDLAGRLKTLREHNIYAIARIVCMFDPTLSQAKPEWAVRNSKTGGIWKNANGVAWANAMRPEVWEYNTAFAVEAAKLGFDEVQYDYVRFPTDGDMDALDVGGPNTSATRTAAIHNFLKMTHDALAQYGVALGADIFGIALWDPNDNGIGQQLEQIAPVVDYIHPMIYPSHFYPGSLGFDIPNDHPYEVILESLLNGDKRIADGKVKFRPWLQDFTYGPGIDYGPNEVRAQVKATNDYGATGWMLWNANATFTEAGLLPEKTPR